MTVLVTRGLGHSGGVFATRGLGIGLVVVDAQVKGGPSRRRSRRRVIHLLRREDQFNLRKILEEEGVSEITKDLLLRGEGVVDGKVIVADAAPVVPTKPDIAVPLSEISDEIDREIAELIRIQEQISFEEQIKEFRKQILLFDEELLLFIILMDC